MKEIIAQGAEAILYKVREKNKTFIVKERQAKGYRLPVLDEQLRKLRTRREVSILEKVGKIIPVPQLIKKGDEEKTKKIQMEFLPGKKVAEIFDTLSPDEQEKIAETIGEQIGLLHNAHIIHGDLTTSNMILSDNKVYFIDFGLSAINQKVEHKAVDLHLVKQAFESKHHRFFEKAMKALLNGYKRTAQDAKEVLIHLDKVETRGHYKKKN